MKKIKLKAKRVSTRAKAVQPFKLGRTRKLTVEEKRNIALSESGAVGYHTKPVAGYIGVFDPSVPGRRPVPSQMPHESAQRFDDRWRRHYGIPIKGEVAAFDKAKPPLPANQIYLNGRAIQFVTADEIRAIQKMKARQLEADAKAEKDRQKGRVILQRGGHFKMRARPPKKSPKLKVRVKAEVPELAKARLFDGNTRRLAQEELAKPKVKKVFNVKLSAPAPVPDPKLALGAKLFKMKRPQ